MDGFPALDLWDMVVEVFHSSSHQAKGPKQQARWDLQRNKPSGKHTNTQIKTQIHHNDLQLSSVDYVSLLTLNLLVLAPCLTFLKKNGAVIKMIIKSQSPTMRHVSRTHRVAVDWSFGRINLDPKIQIKYVDTKQKPTLRHTDKGQFHTWWVEPSSPSVQYQHFSSASCPQTMSNRIQEWTVEERKMAKPRPTLNLVSKNVASFSTAPSSSASNVPVILKATSQSLSLRACMRGDLLKIQIKMTQRRVLKCGK